MKNNLVRSALLQILCNATYLENKKSIYDLVDEFCDMRYNI